MSMTAFFLVNAKVKFIFFNEKFGDLYVQNMSCVPPDYMRRQFEIKENMRAVLIDWLLEVHICSYTGSICCHAQIRRGLYGLFLRLDIKILQVHLRFDLMPETLYLTVNIIDRYISIQSVGLKELHGLQENTFTKGPMLVSARR